MGDVLNLGWTVNYLKTIISGDGIDENNKLFKLHTTVNFLIVMFGAFFVTGMNVLNGDAIVCFGKDVGNLKKLTDF